MDTFLWMLAAIRDSAAMDSPWLPVVISGIIIYLCAFSMLFRGKIHALLFKNADKTNVNAEPAAPAKSATEKEGK